MRICEYCEHFRLDLKKHEGHHRIRSHRIGAWVWACDRAFEHFRNSHMEPSKIKIASSIPIGLPRVRRN
jgi:hypothetical protein